METNVRLSKGELNKLPLRDLKHQVEKDAWVSLKQYFDGRGNGPEAKIAVVVVGTLAKEKQAENNSRQLDIVEKKLLGLNLNKDMEISNG